jgi:hypothetical protein
MKFTMSVEPLSLCINLAFFKTVVEKKMGRRVRKGIVKFTIYVCLMSKKMPHKRYAYKLM